MPDPETELQLDEYMSDDCSRLDFARLYDDFDWVRAMAATGQDLYYHGEGDVWTHTQMVCAALTDDPEWDGLDRDGRRVLMLAALLHDAGKPDATATDPGGRQRSPNHAVRGESLARRLLWRMGAPYALREEVAALTCFHMDARDAMKARDPRRAVYAMSLVLRCDRLALLSRADTRGRISPVIEPGLERLSQFTAFCTGHGCLSQPRAFDSDHARFLYFRKRIQDPDAVAPSPAGPRVTVLSGLPGSGKDTWLSASGDDRPVISLDAIRIELGVDPAAPDQEPVVTLAHERVRRLLAEGSGFVWNATTLGRRHRRTLLDLIVQSDPRVDIVYLEVPAAVLLERNRTRPAAAAVSEDVIHGMTHIWQPPDPTEAHAIKRVLQTSAAPSAPRS